MNANAILAALVLKNILTVEEAEAIAEFVHDKPQSTILSEVIKQVKELLPMHQPLTGGPEQQAEELAARERVAAEQKAAEEAEQAANAEEGDAKEADASDAKPAKK